MHVHANNGFPTARVVLGDKKVNSSICSWNDHDAVMLEMTDRSDNTGNQKVNVQLVFKDTEALDVMEMWLAGVREQFNARAKHRLAKAFEGINI